MSTNRQYLENRVNTASPAQLHLMLIDGAIRFAGEAADRYEANDVDAASRPLRRAMDIASELLASVRHSETELNQKLASLYEFVFTRLTMAFVNTDRDKLAEAVRILEVQRETWRQACEKSSGASSHGASAPGPTSEAPGDPPRGPHTPIRLSGADPTAGGLSIEA
ncbi:MAG: flagellar export chaperone FliS [Planctomycetota bacterium]